MSEIVAVYSHPVGNSSLFFNLNVTYTFKLQCDKEILVISSMSVSECY